MKKLLGQLGAYFYSIIGGALIADDGQQIITDDNQELRTDQGE
jgi:hypothetical protein